MIANIIIKIYPDKTWVMKSVAGIDAVQLNTVKATMANLMEEGSFLDCETTNGTYQVV